MCSHRCIIHDWRFFGPVPGQTWKGKLRLRVPATFFPAMPIVVIGLSHHSSTVAVRERFAFAEARIPTALQLLRDSGTADEAVILSTCNRVEIYASTTLDPAQAFTGLQEFLVTCHDYRDPITDEIYSMTEPHSIEHLFKVACGLDSMV